MIKILILIIFAFFLNAASIAPIPEKVDFDYKKALLGKKLFFETKLSVDNTISCATCHDLNDGGDDGLAKSFGVDGNLGDVNAPTVLNSVFNFSQFWDGRAKDLKEQAIGPIENPVEMAHNFKNIIKDLNNSSEYKKEFEIIYEDGITKDNIVDAIAEFEKTLITPNSRFDRFLKGDKTALTQYEREGYEIFKNKGCITCHHGINVGGNHYNKFGSFSDIESANLGRYNVTGDEEDKYYFKVPTLRNIELTAPYFHDGREDNLKDAVKTMALVQLGRPITDEEINKIIAFLKTLTGKLEIIK